MRKRQKIGHKRPSRAQFFTRERPKLEHNPACGRSMKTWAQLCKHFTVHQASENTKSNYMYKFNDKSGRTLCKSGRAHGIQAGCKRLKAGHSALANMPSWNISITCFIYDYLPVQSLVGIASSWPTSQQPIRLDLSIRACSPEAQALLENNIKLCLSRSR